MTDERLPSRVPDYEPLLTEGMHYRTLDELRDRCVATFPLSSTRPGLMANLDSAIARLNSAGVPGEVWIDGSFLTAKIDPADVDLVLRTSAMWFENDATPEQREAVERFDAGLRDSEHLDAYYFCIGRRSIGYGHSEKPSDRAGRGRSASAVSRTGRPKASP